MHTIKTLSLSGGNGGKKCWDPIANKELLWGVLAVLSLDSNSKFLIRKLYTGNGVGARVCEEGILVFVAGYVNRAQTSIRGTNKREALIYPVGELDALAFFNRYLRRCEK